MGKGSEAGKGMDRLFAAGGPSGRAVLRLFCLLALVLPPLSARAAVPAAPTELRATAVYSNKIELAWNDNSSDETNFYVEYLVNGNWTSLRTLSANNTAFTHSNLPQDTDYTYRVRAYNASGSSYSNELPARTGILSAPSGLAASTISYTQITLAWEDNSNDENGFYIERKTPTTEYVQVGSAGMNATTFINYSLVQGTEYSYRVRAYNYATPAHNYSEYAYLEGVKTKEVKAPLGLSATATASNEVQLAWTDNSDDETNFYIYRKTQATGYIQAGSVGANVTNYSNKNVNQDTEYTYSVRAYVGGNYSGYADPVTVTTPSLNAPSDLAVESISYASVKLAWTDNSSDESGFYVERLASPGGAAAQTYYAPANASSYLVSSLSQGTEYYFRVRAYNYGYSPSYNYSAYTDELSVTTMALIAPSDFAAEPVASSQIRLAWTPAPDGATHYYIYYKESLSGGSYSSATAAAPASSYTITNLKQETEYTFYLKSYNGGYYSPPTDTVTAKTLPLAAPSDLSASSVSYKEATIAWTDNTPDESGFRIERKTGENGVYGLVYTSGANTTSYRNTGLTPGTEYFYRAQTYRNTYVSAYSEDLPVKTKTFDAPTNLSAEPVSSTKVRLTWQDNTSDESSFCLEYKEATQPDNSYRQAPVVPENATSAEVSGLVPNTKYSFRIRAYGSAFGGYSDYKGPVDATTLSFGAPSDLTATALSSTQIQLAWKDNTGGEGSFRIQYKIGETVPDTFYQLSDVPAKTTTFTHTNRTPNTTYVYRVQAYSSVVGYTLFSNEAFAKAEDPPPAELLAAALSSRRIRLTWTDAPAETQYSLEYRIGATGAYSVLATLPANTTSYDHTDLAAGGTYSYRYRTNSGAAYSSYSNEAIATTPECVEEGMYQP